MVLKTTRSVCAYSHLILIALLTSVPSAFSGTPDAKCYWAAQAITVNGKSDDWRTSDGAYFEREKAVLMAANDNDYLYLLLRTNDLQSVRIIKRNGLTLYVDAEGGKKKSSFSLHYRGGPDMQMLRAAMPPDTMKSDEDRPRRFGKLNRETPPGAEDPMPPDTAPSRTVLTCKIEDWLLDKELTLDGSYGPMVAFDTSQGFYTYEFRIPLAEANVQYYGIGADPGKKVSIGAIWGDMKEQKGKKPELDFGLGDFEGGGSRMGGGMGSPTGGGRMAPEFRTIQKVEKREIWAKVTLVAGS